MPSDANLQRGRALVGLPVSSGPMLGQQSATVKRIRRLGCTEDRNFASLRRNGDYFERLKEASGAARKWRDL
jgi:hypothetical protein